MSNGDGAQSLAAESKEALERDKLRFEIAELRKPFYLRPANWFSLVAAVVAVGGFFGQSLLSSIKVERALLEAAQKQQEASNRIAAAESQEIEAAARAAAAEAARAEAEAKTKNMRAEVVELESDKRALDAQINDARTGLERAIGLIDELKSAGVADDLIARIEDELTRTADTLASCTKEEAAAYDKALVLQEEEATVALLEHLPWGVPRPAEGPESPPNLVQAWWIGSYDRTAKVPAWVAYRLDGSDIVTRRRIDCWRPDPRFNADEIATDEDYREPVYDRGHLVSPADMRRSEAAAASADIYTNIAPQIAELNRRGWAELERLVREWASEYGTVFVISGPAFDRNSDGRPDAVSSAPTIGRGKVAVPSHFFKIVARVDGNLPSDLIGFLMPNADGAAGNLRVYVISVDAIEAVTGLNFFPDLVSEDFEQRETDAVRLERW
jgi:endonuclease G, mitochondrial